MLNTLSSDRKNSVVVMRNVMVTFVRMMILNEMCTFPFSLFPHVDDTTLVSLLLEPLNEFVN